MVCLPMATKPDSLNDVTPNFLRELQFWLDPWMKGTLKGETGGAAATVGALEWEDVGTFASGVTIPAGGSFTFYNSVGQPIFRINEDGSLQGKTGKALTFNL